MCENIVTRYVERGYGYREIKQRCGRTGRSGRPLYCDSCQEYFEKRYPQGWMNYPGDICRHGNYVGSAGGPDYICGYCEAGE